MDLINILIITLSLLPFLVMRMTKKFILFAIIALFAIFLHGIFLFGYQILYFLLIIYIVCTIAELVSLKTRFNCFGVKYSYNLNHSFFIKMNLLGVYPIEISFAWVILKYISFNTAFLISQAFLPSPIFVIFLTPLILVSQDLIIDPVAVNVAKMWEWEKGTKYFGIPWQNFLGWYLVGFISSLIFSFVDTGRVVSFSYLFILPVLFYALLLQNVNLILKLDKTKTILGLLPGIFWTFLGTVSLVVLYFRQS